MGAPRHGRADGAGAEDAARGAEWVRDALLAAVPRQGRRPRRAFEETLRVLREALESGGRAGGGAAVAGRH